MIGAPGSVERGTTVSDYDPMEKERKQGQDMLVKLSKNSKQVIVNSGQAGLTLARDNYVRTDPRSVEIRTKFVEHMANMFKLLGESPEKAASDAKTVMDLQTRLANASKAPADLRDQNKNYNKIPEKGVNIRVYTEGEGDKEVVTKILVLPGKKAAQ